MFKEFKEFAVKGNVVDMAVGIIIGAAFTAIVQSLVNDIVMPPIGMVLGNVDFTDMFMVLREGTLPGPYETLAAASGAGAVTWNYGRFFTNIISFLIVAFAVFLLVRSLMKLKRKEQETPVSPTEKNCPYCYSSIAVKATRCPNCTSELKQAA